jgi:hypothetical protein
VLLIASRSDDPRRLSSIHKDYSLTLSPRFLMAIGISETRRRTFTSRNNNSTLILPTVFHFVAIATFQGSIQEIFRGLDPYPPAS